MRWRLLYELVGAGAVASLAFAPASSADPVSAGVVQSATGFIGCVDPGFTPGVTTNVYCFVAQPLSGGPGAGSLAVQAWTLAATTPATVTTDEQVTVSASALQVGADGSFTFAVDLPKMGS